MEALSPDDAPQVGGQPGGAQMVPFGQGIPPQNQQLPPQMFTTAAQLLDLTDSTFWELPGFSLHDPQPAEGLRQLQT